MYLSVKRLSLLLGLSALVWAEPIRLTMPATPESGGPPVPAASQTTRCRVKDIAQLAGLNSHSLTGYGLVAGLPNTGDSQGALSSPLVAHLLARLGMQLTPQLSNGLNRNVAVVAVTAEMPPFCRSGDRLDVRVASLGDAKELAGGLLLTCLLQGPNGKVYASAQGSVSPTTPTRPVQGSKPAVVGAVSAGATLAANLESPALTRETVFWQLHQPDLCTAQKLSEAFLAMGLPSRVVGPSGVELNLAGQTQPMATLAACSELEVAIDRSARIVCDQRTGTVVAGAEVRLLPTTVSHRGVTLEVGPGATLKGVVEALQKAGATPADVLGIVQTLHQVGSLSGELVIR